MLISDAHEWINEIPTVPIYYLAKPQPRERAWQNQRGKKTLNLRQDVRGQQRGRFIRLRPASRKRTWFFDQRALNRKMGGFLPV